MIIVILTIALVLSIDHFNKPVDPSPLPVPPTPDGSFCELKESKLITDDRLWKQILDEINVVNKKQFTKKPLMKTEPMCWEDSELYNRCENYENTIVVAITDHG